MPFISAPPGPFWLQPFISAPQESLRPSKLMSMTNGWSQTPLMSGLPSGVRGTAPGFGDALVGLWPAAGAVQDMRMAAAASATEPILHFTLILLQAFTLSKKRGRVRR